MAPILDRELGNEFLNSRPPITLAASKSDIEVRTMTIVGGKGLEEKKHPYCDALQ
ncbi:hypothetical protein ACODM8_09960 [Vibrio ostreicida]|uniref:Uncharacterized protein n=1 Tax=Vibrio ostreicida TaxID=526588 RepID=A0ABT8BY23_9VIBR|nr:hypothetical protein [Vibrio ostreicida]MDN3611956.1 hypothetical protein [Vibrio ostreicida]NPD08865.1 hypothetical protein [Vibrio ostreicida]